MPEETTVVKELNENTPTEEILENSPDAQEEAKSSSSSTEDKTADSDKTGEVDKTQSQEAGADGEKSEEEKEEEGLLQSKNPIPYERFSKTIQQRNEIKKELAKVSEILEAYHSDPDVFRVILKKQGYSDDKISEYFKEQGFEEGKKEDKTQTKDIKSELGALTKGLDLTTQEGWLEANYRIAQKVADERAKANLSEYDKGKATEKNIERSLQESEKSAKKLCEDVYKIPYGEAGKDEKNLKTAVGKIFSYAERNPDKLPNVWGLGHVALLKLAMSEEGFKLGERKGKEDEKNRQKNLKSSAVEGEENTSGADDTPNENWPTDKILKWREKHQQ
jgi:hypothetical protein